MPQPTVQRSRVGVQQLKIYPWIKGASIASYVDANASQLFGLQDLGVTKSSTSAKVTGGETVHTIAAFETTRETKVKVGAQQSDLGLLKVLLGGDFTLQAAAGGSGEIQHYSETPDGRAPYFVAIGRSTNGDGTDTPVFAKCRLDGAVNFNLQKDQVTALEFEFIVVLDRTYVKQDGEIGGIGEHVFGELGEVALHT